MAGEVAAALRGSRVRIHAFHFFGLAHLDGQVDDGADNSLVNHALNHDKGKEVEGDIDT